MIRVWTDQNSTSQMFVIMLLFVLLCPITYAGDLALKEDALNCVSHCGCDGLYIYDPATDSCLVNFKKVMKKVIVIYDKSNTDVLVEDGMAKTIYIEGEKIFRGIMISVILFGVCASICVTSACIYCCRINYTDRTLKTNVKALAKKLKRDYNSKKMVSKRAPLPPISESCNVVVEPAGIFVA